MREIAAIIVIYIAQRVTDFEGGGFAFALPVIIGFIALIYLCLAFGERFFAGDMLSWFRIDPERPPLPDDEYEESQNESSQAENKE